MLKMTGRICLLQIIFLTILEFTKVTAINFTVNPTTIKIGFTRYMEVNCTAAPDKTANFSSLVSINLLHSETSENSGFLTMATIDVFDGVKVFEHETAYGYISSDEESYLGMNWTFPSKWDGGWYRCEAHGVNSAFHPVNVSSTVKVIAEKPDFDSMIEAFRIMKASAIYNCSYSELLRSRYEKAQASAFETPSINRGSKYFLSKPSKRVFSPEVRASCELYGGHLANIDDFNEWDFVKNYSSSFGDGVKMVMIEGTDDSHELQWVSVQTNTNLTYTRWAAGQPTSDAAKNCLFLSKDVGWNMTANSCTLDDINLLPRFLCKSY